MARFSKEDAIVLVVSAGGRVTKTNSGTVIVSFHDYQDKEYPNYREMVKDLNIVRKRMFEYGMEFIEAYSIIRADPQNFSMADFCDSLIREVG